MLKYLIDNGFVSDHFYNEVVDLGVLRRFRHNDGKVLDGLFRSNNPSAKRYQEYADRGVRSVVNLRNDVEKPPTRIAKENAERSGVTYVNFPLSARKAPKPEKLLNLLDLLDNLEQPILLHCKSGADRTGLVSAFWLLEKGQSFETARQQLSLRYLHFRDFETGILDIVLDQYAPYHGKMSLRDWIRDHYNPDKVRASFSAAQKARRLSNDLTTLFVGLFRYAQYREKVWHRTFNGPAVTVREKRRAKFYIDWIDHGILRAIWRNRAQVGPGILRSNHPTPNQFRQEARDGLRTVVNLRGASNEPQYLLERAICAQLELKLIDFAIPATKRPTRALIKNLMAEIERADKPLLIHCKSGADRTGIACAALVLSMGGTIQEARKQLSPRFLHFRTGRKGILDTFLDEFEEAQAKTGIQFQDWLDV